MAKIKKKLNGEVKIKEVAESEKTRRKYERMYDPILNPPAPRMTAEEAHKARRAEVKRIKKRNAKYQRIKKANELGYV